MVPGKYVMDIATAIDRIRLLDIGSGLIPDP
jgi:hypothetical protein